MIQTQRILAEIDEERFEQDKKWGGPEADDRLQPRDWASRIEHHVQRGLYKWNKAIETNPRDPALMDYRKELIRIAALAVAATEAFDRYRQTLRDTMPPRDNSYIPF